MTFKDLHPELQHLVREHMIVREHNLRFKDGDPQHSILMFAEGALIVLVLERFVRAVLGADAKDNDTMYSLLQRAVSRGLLRVPWDDQEDGIRRIKDMRNTLLHGNYEQAAKQAGCASILEYFQTQYASEIERMCQITDYMMKQIDLVTGQSTGWPGSAKPA